MFWLIEVNRNFVKSCAPPGFIILKKSGVLYGARSLRHRAKLERRTPDLFRMGSNISSLYIYRHTYIYIEITKPLKYQWEICCNIILIYMTEGSNSNIPCATFASDSRM
jgi:hypothetical protein